MSRVRVTVERPCPELCDDGVIRVYGLNGLQTGEERCERCHGRGVVDEPVTCRTCEHWASLLNGTVTRCTLIGRETAGTFGCAAWDAIRADVERAEDQAAVPSMPPGALSGPQTRGTGHGYPVALVVRSGRS